MGGPATAGKRWPHFFQMGKLRHKEVFFFLGTCPRSLTVSQLFRGRGAAHTLRNMVSPIWRARGRNGLGLPGGDITLSEGTQGVGLQNWVFSWYWVCQVQCRKGHSGENSISGKTGIHFKISAQKG